MCIRDRPCDLCQGQSIQGQGHKLRAKGQGRTVPRPRPRPRPRNLALRPRPMIKIPSHESLPLLRAIWQYAQFAKCPRNFEIMHAQYANLRPKITQPQPWSELYLTLAKLRSAFCRPLRHKFTQHQYHWPTLWPEPIESFTHFTLTVNVKISRMCRQARTPQIVHFRWETCNRLSSIS